MRHTESLRSTRAGQRGAKVRLVKRKAREGSEESEAVGRSGHSLGALRGDGRAEQDQKAHRQGRTAPHLVQRL